MKKGFSKVTVIGAYCYLIIPFLLFVGGYCKWWISIPMTIVVLVALYRAIRTSTLPEISTIGKKQFYTVIITIILIIIWVYLSGIGNLVPQNSDQESRNGIYETLVNNRWPVERGKLNTDFLAESRVLVYYIGFWLPSAVVGKVFGIQAGYYAQIVWAVIGIALVCSLMWHWKSKISIATILFLIFWGGLDYLGFIGTEMPPILSSQHLEWYTGVGKYQYSSMTTQLGYVFNQAIPTWVATALLMNLKSKKSIVLIWGAVMLNAAFPFIGLIPVVIYFILKDVNHLISHAEKETKVMWRKEVFSFQNVIGGGVIGITTFLYFISNDSGKKIGTVIGALQNGTETLVASVSEKIGIIGNSVNLQDEIGTYCLFIMLEIGIYVAFIGKRQVRNGLFYLIIAELLLIPFFKVGYSADFCMRASIPLLFILMMYTWEEWEALRWGGIRKITLLVTLAIASITAIHEIYRVAWYLREGYDNEIRSSYTILSGKNFSSPKSGFFFDVMCKENKDDTFIGLDIHYTEEPEGVNYMIAGSQFSVEENAPVAEALHLIFDGWVYSDIMVENRGMLDDTTVNTIIEVNGQPIECLSYGNESVILPQELFEDEYSHVITLRMNKQVKLYAVDSLIVKPVSQNVEHERNEEIQ